MEKNQKRLYALSRESDWVTSEYFVAVFRVVTQEHVIRALYSCKLPNAARGDLLVVTVSQSGWGILALSSMPL